MRTSLSKDPATMSKHETRPAPRRSARKKPSTGAHDDGSLDELADTDHGRGNRVTIKFGLIKLTPQLPKKGDQSSQQSERRRPVKFGASIEAEKHESKEDTNVEDTPGPGTHREPEPSLAREEANTGVPVCDDDEKKRLRAENIALKTQLSEGEARLSWYREKVAQLQPTNAWPATEDTEMERDLNILETRIRQFCREYASKSIGKRSLRKMFFREGEAEESRRIGEVDEMLRKEIWANFREIKHKKMAPWLLLSSWLNRYICNEMIMKPFWFVGSYAPKEYQHADLVLHRVHIDLLSAYGEDSKEIHVLRSDLLRLIEVTRAQDLPQGVDLMKSTTSATKLIARMRLATNFLSSAGDMVPGYMAGVDNAEVHEELMAILQIAASICSKIHTQRNGFECGGIMELPNTFSHDSREMEAHGLHTAILSDDPKAMDGKRVLLVTQPRVRLIGRADGSNYGGEPRMVKKAIVWLG